MSMQAVHDFWRRIKDDPALLKQMEALGTDSPRKIHEKILPIALAAGFSFTLEEYETAVEERLEKMHAAGQLSDEAMAQIAGGAARTAAPRFACTGDCSWFVGG